MFPKMVVPETADFDLFLVEIYGCGAMIVTKPLRVYLIFTSVAWNYMK
jgi:hypothetical protein